MKVGVRARIVAATLAAAVVIGLPGAILVETQVSGQILAEVDADLERAGRALVVAWTDGGLDDQVDALSQALSVRLTVIAPDGAVLADSGLDGDRLTGIELHLDRPEVQAAIREGVGRHQRTSSTTGIPSLYHARKVERPDGWVIVRASTPLSRLADARWRVRGTLGLGFALALGLAALSAGLFGRWSQRTLERLVGQARQLSGNADEPAPLTSMSNLTRQLEGAMHDLAAERDVQAALVAAVADGVITVDANGHIGRANTRAAAVLGVPLERLEGASLSEVWRAPGVLTAVTSTRVDRVARSLEVDQPGPPRRLVEAQVMPLYEDGVVVLLHDRTHERAVERMRKDFVANVSHELKTPVAVIAAHAESLLDGGLDDPDFARSSVEATHRQAIRLAHIVTDLLSLSRLEAGGVVLQPRALRVAEVAARATEQAKARSPGRTVDVDVPDDLRVWADPTALDHALGNLAENALQHTPPDAKVVLRAVAAGDRVHLDVVDDGAGIPEEHRDRIFERFYRVDPGRSRDRGGTGLGLAIVRHLAQASGGAASYLPHHPHGSVFRLDLPQPPASESTANA